MLQGGNKGQENEITRRECRESVIAPNWLPVIESTEAVLRRFGTTGLAIPVIGVAGLPVGPFQVMFKTTERSRSKLLLGEFICEWGLLDRSGGHSGYLSIT